MARLYGSRCTCILCYIGGAGHENTGRDDHKTKDQVPRHEIVRHENAGHKNAGHENAGSEFATYFSIIVITNIIFFISQGPPAQSRRRKY